MAAAQSPNDVAVQRERLAEQLRAYGSSFTELGRRFAVALGVHSTDAFALLEISAAEAHGTPLSPVALSKRISLSSGAMTALLNRLEQAGYISRTREHHDRRIVTLRSGDHVKALANDYFRSINSQQDAILSQYSPQLLRQFETLLNELRATLDAHLTSDA